MTPNEEDAHKDSRLSERSEAIGGSPGGSVVF